MNNLASAPVNLTSIARDKLIQDKLVFSDCIRKLKIMKLSKNSRSKIHNKLTKTLNSICLILALSVLGRSNQIKELKAENVYWTKEELKHYRHLLREIAYNCTFSEKFCIKEEMDKQFLIQPRKTEKHGKWKKDYSDIDCINNFTNCMLMLDKIYFSKKLEAEIYLINDTASKSEFIKEHNDAFRFIIKKTLAKTLERDKETGMIALYTIEEFCGYRAVDQEELDLKSDLMEWFGKDYKQQGKMQVETIINNLDVLTISDKVNSKSFEQTVIGNMSVYRRKPILSMYFADGVSSSVKIKQHIFKKRWRCMSAKTSKTILFANMDFSKVERVYNGEFGLIPIVDAEVVQKFERYKVRNIISTDLHSFVLLTEMDYIFKLATRNFIGPYTAMTNEQKISLPQLFTYYLNYNAKYGNTYLCIPLDYTGYDHTISREVIIYAMRYIMDRSCHDAKVVISRIISAFEYYLDTLYVKYRDNRIKYKHGMLSGWKITNSAESFINYMTTRIVMSKVFRSDKIQLITTMGDDMVSVIEAPGLENKLKVVMKAISDEYSKFHIEANPTKNSISYTFIEYLRVAYYPCISMSYPTRAIPALFYSKPTSSKFVLDDAEIFQNVNNAIWRTINMSNRRLFVNSLFNTFTYKSNFDRNLFIKAVLDIRTVDVSIKMKPMAKVKLNDRGFYYQLTRTLIIDKLQAQYKQYIQDTLFTTYQTRLAFKKRKNDPRIKHSTKTALLTFFDSMMFNTEQTPSEFLMVDYNFDNFFISRQFTSTKGNKNTLIAASLNNILQLICTKNYYKYGITISIPNVAAMHQIIKSKNQFLHLQLLVKKEKIKTSQLFASTPQNVKIVKMLIDQLFRRWAHINLVPYANLRNLQVMLYLSDEIRTKIILYCYVISKKVMRNSIYNGEPDVIQAIDG